MIHPNQPPRAFPSTGESQLRTVRTRFAPSPTGFLHVGGARTALYSWLYARKHRGEFVLRVENTDKARDTAESLIGILDDLQWLGLNWDEGPDPDAVRRGVLRSTGPHAPYFQSERNHIYDIYLSRLLVAGRAYFAWETAAELDANRASSAMTGRTYRYQRPQDVISDPKDALRLAGGRPIVVRFKAPECLIEVHDAVLGAAGFPSGAVDDFIIRKADGGPTYHLAVVVDDELMSISHVIRAQEHFSNTPKHIVLQQALNFHVPVYAHLPLVFNQSGGKMSKRAKDRVIKEAAHQWLRASGHGPRAVEYLATELALCLPTCSGQELLGVLTDWLQTDENVLSQGKVRDAVATVAGLTRDELPEIDVADFRRNGFLPDVLLNYVALLGWNAGDDRETYSLSEMVNAFDLKRVGRANARFDRAKLVAMNTRRHGAVLSDPAASAAALRPSFRAYLSANPDSPVAAACLDDRTIDAVLVATHGARTFADVAKKAAMLFVPGDRVQYDAQAIARVSGDVVTLKVLADIRALIVDIPAWSAAAIEQSVASSLGDTGTPLTALIQHLRAAMVGKAISPPIWETLELLGRAAVIDRLNRFLSACTSWKG